MKESPRSRMEDDDSLHSLLSGGRLSGPQRDRILERVLAEHARPRRRWVVALAAALPAAAIALVMLGKSSVSPVKEREWLVPKGASSSPLLTANCRGREPGTCRRGDRLIFEVDGATRQGFFAAYAQCGSSERLWYFPSETGSVPTVPAGGHFVLPQVARIGDEHREGRCTLHLFLLEASVDRATLTSGNVRPAAINSIPLTIEPAVP